VGQHVVVLPPDRFQDGDAAAKEQRYVELDRTVQEIQQPRSFPKQVHGAVYLEAEQLPECLVFQAPGQLRLRVAEPGQVFQWQVYPSLPVVAGHVLPEIGQLQSGTDGIGNVKAFLVSIAE
jgi:hypothetical protein